MSTRRPLWMIALLAIMLASCDRTPAPTPAPNPPREQPDPVAVDGDLDEDTPQAPQEPVSEPVVAPSSISEAQRASIEPLPGDGNGDDPVVAADPTVPRSLSADDIPLDSLIIDPVAPATPEDKGQSTPSLAKTTIRPALPQTPPVTDQDNTIEEIPSR